MTSGDIMSAVDTIVGIGVLLGLVGAFMGGSEAPAQTSAPAEKADEAASGIPYGLVLLFLGILIWVIFAWLLSNSPNTNKSAQHSAKKRRHKPSAAVIPKAKSPSVSLPVKPKPAIKNKPSAAVLKAKSPSTDILKAKSSAPAKPSRASGRKYNIPRAE